MVNINGVLYNATSNKLEKTSLSKSQRAEQLLIIRGQRFTLDSTGTKLKRNCVNENAKSLLRIDIGGLTYKKASTVGSYERDNSHQIRNHLTTARLKSISLLQRNQLKKSNEICPIYRRIGKCLAYAKGKCSKIHDHRYVMVCPKFLKGNCENDKCLLSHNVNFHKMPVCKYYLQGMCSKSKDDCPYLHKKLSDSTKLCTEFLKGYCPLADKVSDTVFIESVAIITVHKCFSVINRTMLILIKVERRKIIQSIVGSKTKIYPRQSILRKICQHHHQILDILKRKRRQLHSYREIFQRFQKMLPCYQITFKFSFFL